MKKTTTEYNAYMDAINASICRDHGGKMAGIQSISTSCLLNPGCQERAKNPDSVCSKCYAQRLAGFRPTLSRKLERNHKFYTSAELQPEDIPFINQSIFRFESFGELSNVLQFQNYCTIAEKNKHCHFSIWSKRPDIIRDYISEGHTLPENLYIILSSPVLNTPLTIEYLQEHDYISFTDAVFTVVTPAFAEEHNTIINCGSKSCKQCQLCYNNLSHDYITFINELLK